MNAASWNRTETVILRLPFDRVRNDLSWSVDEPECSSYGDPCAASPQNAPGFDSLDAEGDPAMPEAQSLLSRNARSSDYSKKKKRVWIASIQ